MINLCSSLRESETGRTGKVAPSRKKVIPENRIRNRLFFITGQFGDQEFLLKISPANWRGLLNISTDVNSLHDVQSLYKGSGLEREDQGQPLPMGINRK